MEIKDRVLILSFGNIEVISGIAMQASYGIPRDVKTTKCFHERAEFQLSLNTLAILCTQLTASTSPAPESRCSLPSSISIQAPILYAISKSSSRGKPAIKRRLMFCPFHRHAQMQNTIKPLFNLSSLQGSNHPALPSFNQKLLAVLTPPLGL